MALSFQDNAGCLDIWRQITHVQSRAAEWFRSHEESSVADMAHAVAAAHHASLQRQQQHAMWVNVASEAAAHVQHVRNNFSEKDDSNAEAVAVSMAAAAAAAYGNEAATTFGAQQQQQQPSLPDPPTLQNLEEIADIIAAAQVCILYIVYGIVSTCATFCSCSVVFSYSNCSTENRWPCLWRETTVGISKHYCLSFPHWKLEAITELSQRWQHASKQFCS